MKSTTKKSVKSRSKKLTVSSPSHASGVPAYEKDFSKWANDQAKLLRKGEYGKLDLRHLIEEIEDLSKREKQRLMSYLEVLLLHMLKVKYQPKKHTSSWDRSIKLSSHKAQVTLSENPSLKSHLKDIVKEAYFAARIGAAEETGLDEDTFPETCQWTVKEIFPDLEKKYC
jgi:hypothetical protein